MSDTPVRHARELLPHAPMAVLQRLPSMGRVMLTTNHSGATHERIGLVEQVEQKNGKALCHGAAHDCAIDLAAIKAVVVDRTGKMKDKVLPRLEFHDAGGKALFSFVGLDGLEPFDAGLADVAGSPVAATTKEQSDQAVLEDGDAGGAPFEAARKARADVVIELRRPGLTQSWRGVIEEVKPAMGFINVMRPDFHLHLRGGAVAGWRREELGNGIVEMIAEDGQSKPTGLVVRGPQSAFGQV